ncbi:MAG: hypothetical protein RJB39_289 [Candidatus Parcubacteria bacterium]|jgi:prepilin-type N-terminal cleavage/methylation domain-containing protein
MSIHNKGFTVVELIVVIALMAMIAGMTFASFSSLNNRQALDKQVDAVKSIVQQTRLASLNSKDGATFSVVFGINKITVKESGTTTVKDYPNIARISLITNGLQTVVGSNATSTISFAKISGLANATGVLTYGLVTGTGSTTSMTKTITVNALGRVE